MRRLAILCAFAIIASPSTAAAGEYSFPGDARYSVSKERMDRRLACRRGRHLSRHSARVLTGSGRNQPVLLVHGTGVTRKQTWKWNYWPVLRERGWEVCWVALPQAALVDIQISSEFVARAIQMMHRATDEKIDVLGHSQGGLQPRWALKWFPSGRFVSDYIALATPNHGTQTANGAVANGYCFEACWQMRRRSRFIRALNRDVETPGRIRYSSIWTDSDELIQPPGTQRLRGGASNISLQNLCPGRPVEHLGILGDFVTWKLVRDALREPGSADRDVVGPEDCLRDRMPGVDEPPQGLADMFDYTQGNATDHEPPLKPYARP